MLGKSFRVHVSVNSWYLNFSLSSDSSAPPTFTDTPPQYVEAKEGGSITLTCTAFGNPKPSVSWLREGSLMVSSAKYKVPNFLNSFKFVFTLTNFTCRSLTIPLYTTPLCLLPQHFSIYFFHSQLFLHHQFCLQC